MDRRQATIAYIQNQCRRYPELEPRDLLKALHQSVFGCGHFVTDEAVGLARLRAELADLNDQLRLLAEMERFSIKNVL